MSKQQKIVAAKAGGPRCWSWWRNRSLPRAGPGAGEGRRGRGELHRNLSALGRLPGPVPFALGSEISGTIEQVGSEVRNLKVGDRVATSEATGGYAQYAVVDARVLGKVPEKVDLRLAAALPLQAAPPTT
ncbi:alcohol dehydrogenase catalytic domain-containing protein [Arthrobacter sp. JCM 19049]|uniref:alcohol dehydrogenase catalytic domain-containing protein n=1 Tax=Arthrobacter sp. JCM 19049 TaxID=1460643 RepID=UPI000A443B2C|nr:alcohol dehydrogenase catalytic domain-containing protein [Arthrobacter sp. JCM 19049]